MHRLARLCPPSHLLAALLALGALAACGGSETPESANNSANGASEDVGDVATAGEADAGDADAGNSSDGDVDVDPGDTGEEPDARPPSCEVPLVACQQDCVDTASDERHCGGCGQTCGLDQQCLEGRCELVCPPEKTECNGACVNTETSLMHCGQCNNRCEAGDVCSSGECAYDCGPGLSLCDVQCVDFASDSAHCGACDQACPGADNATGICQASRCALACSANRADCNQAFGDGCEVSLLSDEAHCGACDQACAPGQYCAQGQCLDAVCGDGIVQTGEQCDGGSCCSSACMALPGCEIERNDSSTMAGQLPQLTLDSPLRATILPATDEDFFAFVVPAVMDLEITTFSGTDPAACERSISTRLELFASDGLTKLAFAISTDTARPCSSLTPQRTEAMRAVAPGTYFVRVTSGGMVVDSYSVQVNVLARCGDGVHEGFEQCDDGNTTSGDGCSAACQNEQGWLCEASPQGLSACRFTCGDAVLDDFEQCDDGNTTSGDGCSATCGTERGYRCQGAPSQCLAFESACSDGQDNDGDGQSDGLDTDCALPPYFQACLPGEQLHVFRQSGPLPIADHAIGQANTPAILPLEATSGQSVTRVAALVNVAHGYIADLSLELVAPDGRRGVLVYQDEAQGADYTNTLFDQRCTRLPSAATAPYSTCLEPAFARSAPFQGTSAQGTWSLQALDQAEGDEGTLLDWSLLLCTTN